MVLNWLQNISKTLSMIAQYQKSVLYFCFKYIRSLKTCRCFLMLWNALPDDTNIVFYIGANQFKKKYIFKWRTTIQSYCVGFFSLKACIWISIGRTIESLNKVKASLFFLRLYLLNYPLDVVIFHFVIQYYFIFQQHTVSWTWEWIYLREI